MVGTINPSESYAKVCGGAGRCVEVCGGLRRGVWRCIEVCGGVCGGAQRCMEVHRGVHGGAQRCTEGCTEVCRGVHGGARRAARRCAEGFLDMVSCMCGGVCGGTSVERWMVSSWMDGVVGVK